MTDDKKERRPRGVLAWGSFETAKSIAISFEAARKDRLVERGAAEQRKSGSCPVKRRRKRLPANVRIDVVDRRITAPEQ